MFPPTAFLWPTLTTVSAERIATVVAEQLAKLTTPVEPAPKRPQPRWATPNRVVLDLPTMRLRKFAGGGTDKPVLICAPFSLHGATVADFARGHSLVAALQHGGLGPVYVTDWRSATPDMRFCSIDSLLADLNVAMDETAGPADLIGICQGGWLALVYAARFSHKVRNLVIAGTPIDVTAGDSAMSRVAKATPLSVFEDLVTLGGGLFLGERALGLWGPETASSDAIAEILQIADVDKTAASRRLAARFRTWYAATVNLPGLYYLQVVRWLYKENRLVKGKFIALGRPVDLARLRLPTFLLAASEDAIVAPEQLFAVAGRLATPANQIKRTITTGPHLSLFMGARTLTEVWPRIIDWLRGPPPDKPKGRRPSRRRVRENKRP